MLNNNNLVLCAAIGFIAWYYFNKFKESEKEYFKLHNYLTEMSNENTRLKSRIKDLQTYKNDVSKTFKILDNELIMINDHLKKQNSEPVNTIENTNRDFLQNTNLQSALLRTPSFENISIGTITRQLPPINRVSILTPNMLNSLFNNINQEPLLQRSTSTNNISNLHTSGNIRVATTINTTVGNATVTTGTTEVNESNKETSNKDISDIPDVETKSDEPILLNNDTNYDQFLLKKENI